MEKEDEDTLAEAFFNELTIHPLVGDGVRSLYEDLNLESISCACCGKECCSDGSGGGRCKGCKALHYCSVECHHQDWEAGHALECKAIADNEHWAAHVNSVVFQRHLERFADAFFPDDDDNDEKDEKKIGDALLIEARGRPRPGPRARIRARRGPARRLGGRRLRYWHRRGWGFPWVYYRRAWYPWWFFLSPTYYVNHIPYVDPYGATMYGFPPAAPGTWGPVPPPPSGTGGYAVPPMAVVQGSIGTPVPLGLALEDVERAITIGARGVGLFKSRGTFEKLMVAHTTAATQLVDAKKREKARAALEKNKNEWVGAMRGVRRPIAEIIQPTGKGDAGKTFSSIMDAHNKAVTNILLGDKKDRASLKSTLFVLDQIILTYKKQAVNAPRLAALQSLRKSDPDGLVVPWADYWTMLTFPVEEASRWGLSKDAIMSRLSDESGHAYVVFAGDMIAHLFCLIDFADGRKTAKECIEEAAIVGGHLDRLMHPDHVPVIKDAITIVEAGLPNLPTDEKKEEKAEEEHIEGHMHYGIPWDEYRRLSREERQVWRNMTAAQRERYSALSPEGKRQYWLSQQQQRAKETRQDRPLYRWLGTNVSTGDVIVVNDSAPFVISSAAEHDAYFDMGDEERKEFDDLSAEGKRIALKMRMSLSRKK